MLFASPDALERARRVKLMLFDVDGVLTDGSLWYGAAGEELKAFNTLDGLGIRLLGKTGVAVAVLSGRSSGAVAVRAAELGIEHVLQGVEDKRGGYDALLRRLGLGAQESGFMGDDLVDVPVLSRCGFACAPQQAPDAVRKRAHFVPAAAAGAGAAREVCEFVMRAQGTLEPALAEYLK